MSLFSVSLNFFSRVELFSASCVHCSCNSSTVISLKWVLVSFFYLLNSPKICCQNMRKLRCKITYKHRWFYSRNIPIPIPIPIILNERALEPTFDATGQWRIHLRFSALSTTAVNSTWFPGSFLYLEKVPWLRLVTCLCMPTEAAQRVGLQLFSQPFILRNDHSLQYRRVLLGKNGCRKLEACLSSDCRGRHSITPEKQGPSLSVKTLASLSTWSM